MIKTSLKIPVLVAVFLFIFPAITNAQSAAGKKVDVYGWFDVEFEKNNKDEAGKRGTFDQHHFNIINFIRLDDHFHIFSEVEYEHGANRAGNASIGAVVLERAFLEYEYSSALKISAGKFVLPYGKYNILHDATPTFLSVFLPSSIYGKHSHPGGGKDHLFAKFGAGIQLRGQVSQGDWEEEYFLYLINGRGDNPYEKDNNKNKGIGGRFIVNPFINNLELGASFYSEKNGNANNAREFVWGTDISYKYQNFQIEWETMFAKLDYSENSNQTMESFAYYVQGAYTLADKFTPYLRYESFDADKEINDNKESDITFGINCQLVSNVYLKAELQNKKFQNGAMKDFKNFAAALVVAF